MYKIIGMSKHNSLIPSIIHIFVPGLRENKKQAIGETS